MNAAETTDGTYVPNIWSESEVDWDEYAAQKQEIYESGRGILVSYRSDLDQYTYAVVKSSFTPFWNNEHPTYVNAFVDYVITVKDGVVTHLNVCDGTSAVAFYNEESGLYPIASNFDYRGNVALLQSYPHSNISYHFNQASPEGDVTASMGLDVEMEATVINISVPLNINLVINVNEEDALVYGDVFITNNSKAPVKVKLQSIASVDLPFTDLIAPSALPQELSWETLDYDNSQKYFSLGLKPETEGNTWKSITANDYIWAEESFTPAELGVIDRESEGKLAFDAYFGRVQTDSKEFTFAAMFVAELE